MGSVRAGVPATLLVSLALAATPTAGSAAPLPSPTGQAATPDAGTTLGYPPEVTAWRLARVRRDGDLRPVPDSLASRLHFASGRATGTTGCRPFTADVFQALAVLHFESLESTGDPTDCPAPGRSLDPQVLAGLKHAAAFQVVPGEEDWQADLVIRDPRGRIVLVYEVDAPAGPDQGLWLLGGVRGEDGVRAVDDAEASPAVLAFEPEEQDPASGGSRGRLVGSTGCNGFEARYELRGRVLELDDLAVTDSPCPPAQAERQDDVLAVLGASPVRLDLAPDSLTLGADGPAGATLLYEPGSPLEGSTWQLTRVAGAELPPDAIVTVRLDGGRLTGIGLCGTFEADYVTNGVRIEMGDVARAPGRCREAQVDDALMAALGSAAFVRRTGGGLSLLDAEGRDRARFRHPGGP